MRHALRQRAAVDDFIILSALTEIGFDIPQVKSIHFFVTGRGVQNRCFAGLAQG